MDLQAFKDHARSRGYALTGRVGRGGLGEVFQAVDSEGRSVALKTLHAEDPKMCARFLREARLGLRLSHPHLVPALYLCEDPPPFLVMELIPVPSLGQRLGAGIRLTEAEATIVLRQTAQALAYLHGASVLHRDVKPGNLLFCHKRSHTWLCDLGIARDLDASRLTATGEAVGTLIYLAPEVFSGAEIDPGVDAYGLGATLYACVTGVPPFRDARDAVSLIRKLLREPPPDVRRQRPDLSRALADTIHALLEKSPKDRPSLQELGSFHA